MKRTLQTMLVLLLWAAFGLLLAVPCCSGCSNQANSYDLRKPKPHDTQAITRDSLHRYGPFVSETGERLTCAAILAEAPEPEDDERCPTCNQITKHAEHYMAYFRYELVGDHWCWVFKKWDTPP